MPELTDDTQRRAALVHPDSSTPAGLLEIGLEAVLFDLDGVVTRTASLHARAWQQLFNEYLAERAAAESFTPFRLPEDYLEYVDGKPRYDGVRAFLTSRGLDLPFGDPSDPPSGDTICGLGNRKNGLFVQVLAEHGVEVFDGTVAFILALRTAGLKTACVSSSKNCRPVLERAALTNLFDVIYDGHDLEREGRPGKPHPDAFRRAAALMGVEPRSAAVVEDAVAGVTAGRAGGFRLVVGIDRGVGAATLRRAGANLVVSDLSEIALGHATP